MEQLPWVVSRTSRKGKDERTTPEEGKQQRELWNEEEESYGMVGGGRGVPAGEQAQGSPKEDETRAETPTATTVAMPGKEGSTLCTTASGTYSHPIRLTEGPYSSQAATQHEQSSQKSTPVRTLCATASATSSSSRHSISMFFSTHPSQLSANSDAT